MRFRDLLVPGGLLSASLVVGCGGNNRHLTVGSSSASWLDNPAQFPVTEEMHIVCMEPTSSAFEERNNSLPLRVVRFTFIEGDNICSIAAGPTCTENNCIATLSMIDWGICMAKITGITFEDDEEVSTCWHKAMFLGSEKMAEQEAAIDAARQRCEDAL